MISAKGETYGIDSTIVSTALGKVLQARSTKTNETVIIKVLPRNALKSEKDVERFYREVTVHRLSEHENIVKTIAIVDEEDAEFDGNNTILVLEHCDRDLFEEIALRGSVDEVLARKWFLQLMQAIRYLHSVIGIVHRDIKPENILLKTVATGAKIVKLSDFGLCHEFDFDAVTCKEALLWSRCGSPFYVAPELLRGNGYGESVDIWSAGIVLFAMISGEVPFIHDDLYILLDMIIQGNFDFPENLASTLSPEVKDLIRKLLQPDVTQRIRTDRIFEHPWLVAEAAPSPAPRPSRALASHLPFSSRRDSFRSNGSSHSVNGSPATPTPAPTTPPAPPPAAMLSPTDDSLERNSEFWRRLSVDYLQSQRNSGNVKDSPRISKTLILNAAANSK